MSDGNLHAAYQKLDAAARHVIQICALSPKVLGRKDVAALSNKSGWKDRNGKGLTQAATGQIIDKASHQNLLVRSSYGSVAVNGAVEDQAVQDSIRQNWFDKLRKVIDDQASSRSYYLSTRTRFARDLRIAFYGNRVPEFQSLANRAKYEAPVRLLDPFSRDIFDRLDPVLREMYLLDTVPQVFCRVEHGRVRLFDGPGSGVVPGFEIVVRAELPRLYGNVCRVRRRESRTRPGRPSVRVSRG